MGNEEKKYEDWGLSLSLKPPITHQNHHNKSVYKRHHEVLCSIEKQTQKMQKFNTKPMSRPRSTIGEEMTVKEPKVPALPLVIDLEEVEIPKQSSPSPESTLTSSGIGKGLCGNLDGEGHFANDEEEAAATCGGGGGNGGEGERKKLRLTKEQIMVLEQAFREHSTVNAKQKLALARQVNLNPRQVEVWFQNRRARTKLKQMEAECEQLRRLCESLKEEKRNLQKEVQELKNLQVISRDHEAMSMYVIHANSHQLPPNPTSTLNLCPSCKSVFISTFSSLGKETQMSQKLTLDIFLRLRAPLLDVKKQSTSSAITIRQYGSD